MRVLITKILLGVRWVGCLQLVLGLTTPAFAAPEEYPGYLSQEEVEEERHQIIREMVIVAAPEKRPPLRDIIFDARLSKEFQTKYGDKFGRTEAERNLTVESRFDEFRYENSLSESFEQDQANKRRFGEYMFRRLSEHHVDQYMKGNPEIRPIYELKDRISRVNVQVAKSYKLKMNYSYSGNHMDFRLDNPLNLDPQIRLQMNEGSVGPSEVEEVIYSLGWEMPKNISMATYYHQIDGKVSLVTAVPVGEGLSTSLTLARYFGDKPQTDELQDLVLVGFTWLQ